jgi:hypothetical protein
MLSQIKCKLESRPHPYSQEPSAATEAWGLLSLTVVTQHRSIQLLTTEWDLGPFASWYVENRYHLLHDMLLVRYKTERFSPLPGESLARALQRLTTMDFPEEDETLIDLWTEQIFDYRQRHSLRFALRGAQIPEMIVGCNAGHGEISQSEEEPEWMFPFEMQTFCTALDQELYTFLSTTSKKMADVKWRTFYTQLTQQLHEYVG